MPHPAKWLQRIEDPDILRLAYYMEATKVSYAEMAKRIGVHPHTVGRWLTNRAQPSADIRRKLTHLLASTRMSVSPAPSTPRKKEIPTVMLSPYVIVGDRFRMGNRTFEIKGLQDNNIIRASRVSSQTKRATRGRPRFFAIKAVY
jgi:transcriptional regulator with XRE-family HTH domain